MRSTKSARMRGYAVNTACGLGHSSSSKLLTVLSNLKCGVHVNKSAGTQGGQKKISGFLGLAVVRHPILMLGKEPRVSARAAHAHTLNSSILIFL